MLLTACGTEPQSPDRALDDALLRTLTRPFAFSLSIELDEDARAALREGAAGSTAVVDTLEVRGSVHDAGHVLSLSALGFELLESRRIDGERSYIRLDLSAVATLAGDDWDPSWYLDELGELRAQHRVALEELLAGRWIGVDVDAERLDTLVDEVGVPGASLLGTEAARGELKDALEAHVAATPGEFLDRYAVVDETRSGDVRHLDVDLLLRPLLDALSTALSEAGPAFAHVGEALREERAEMVDRLSGLSVDVSDRLVQRVTVDLLAAARSAGAEDVPEGSLRVVVALSEHGTAPAVRAPEDATVVDLADLLEDLGPRHPHYTP